MIVKKTHKNKIRDYHLEVGIPTSVVNQSEGRCSTGRLRPVYILMDCIIIIRSSTVNGPVGPSHCKTKNIRLVENKAA